MRVDLPDGEWAEFCSPRKVSDRRRRAYISRMSDVSAATANVPLVPGPPDPATGLPGPMVPDGRFMTGEQTEMQFQAFDLLIMCFLKAWSLPGEPNLETLEDLDTGSKDVLTAKALSLMNELMPDYGADIDPKAPTGPSLSPGPLSSATAELISATHSSGNTS